MNKIDLVYEGIDVEVQYEYVPPYQGSAFTAPSDWEYYGVKEIIGVVNKETEEYIEDVDEEEIWKLIDYHYIED